MSPHPDQGTGAAVGGSTEPRTFEAAYLALQQVVDQLDDAGLGHLDLERAMRLYERGTELAQACERILDSAELRVTRLAAEVATPLSDTSVDA